MAVNQGRNQGVARVAKATPKILRQNYKAKNILFTTFTLHIKQHSELQKKLQRLECLVMLLVICKSTDLTLTALMQLLTDLPPLQHGDYEHVHIDVHLHLDVTTYIYIYCTLYSTINSFLNIDV